MNRELKFPKLSKINPSLAKFLVPKIKIIENESLPIISIC